MIFLILIRNVSKARSAMFECATKVRCVVVAPASYTFMHMQLTVTSQQQTQIAGIILIDP
jgi:hypothetical protein